MGTNRNYPVRVDISQPQPGMAEWQGRNPVDDPVRQAGQATGNLISNVYNTLPIIAASHVAEMAAPVVGRFLGGVLGLPQSSPASATFTPTPVATKMTPTPKSTSPAGSNNGEPKYLTPQQMLMADVASVLSRPHTFGEAAKAVSLMPAPAKTNFHDQMYGEYQGLVNAQLNRDLLAAARETDPVKRQQQYEVATTKALGLLGNPLAFGQMQTLQPPDQTGN